MTLSRTTRDHDEIRRWAEARGAVPSAVKGTERGGEAGIIRFEFPNAPDSNDTSLEEISWEDFFEKFDRNNLELLYQNKTSDGRRSNFNKLVHPDASEHYTRASKAHGSSSAKPENQGEHRAA